MSASRADADESLVALLAAGHSQAAAAETLNMSARTVGRRMADPGFAARVKAARAEMVAAAAGKLADSMTAAVLVLRSLLASKTEGIKLRAADVLLNQAVKVSELYEIEQRLAALEQLQQAKGA